MRIRLILCNDNSEQSCELSRKVVKEFLRVDEYVNMDPLYARDAGLTIQAVKLAPDEDENYVDSDDDSDDD